MRTRGFRVVRGGKTTAVRRQDGQGKGQEERRQDAGGRKWAYNPARALRTRMFADRTHWSLAPNRLSEALEQRRRQGGRVVDLTASNPTVSGFEYDYEAIVRALADPASLTYSPDPRGLPPAREAVAKYYDSHGCAVAAGDLLLATSTSEAYSWVFRTLCNPGDSLLIPAPSYPLFGFLADLADVELVRYPLVYDHGWQIDLRALEPAITPRTRGVIVVHPNNPTGNFVKARESAELARICASRGMTIIADEVFLDFPLEAGETRQSFATQDAALTFTLSGLSKISGLPQMKAAWVVVSGPAGLKKQALDLLELIADTYLSPSAPVQAALPALLAQRDGFQRQVIARLRRNLAELDRALVGHGTASRLKVEGGWYATLRVAATRSDEDLAIELLNTHGVYIHPGHFFDFVSDGYVVVSLLTPERDFAEGVGRLLSM